MEMVGRRGREVGKEGQFPWDAICSEATEWPNVSLQGAPPSGVIMPPTEDH